MSSCIYQRFYLHIRGCVVSKLWPNRATSSETVQNYYARAEEVHKLHLTGSENKVDFKTLAIDPACQRHGFGEKLVEWCDFMAWQDDVPVFGDATTKGLPLYLKVGCKEIGQIHPTGASD
jgi:GNAT superfamily N-acetyltransferase